MIRPLGALGHSFLLLHGESTQGEQLCDGYGHSSELGDIFEAR